MRSIEKIQKDIDFVLDDIRDLQHYESRINAYEDLEELREELLEAEERLLTEHIGSANMDYKEFLERKDFSSPQKIAEWMEDAIKIITELVSKNDELKRERDEAIEQLNGNCDCCVFQEGCKRPESTVGCEHWKWNKIKDIIESYQYGRGSVAPVKVGDKVYYIKGYFNESKFYEKSVKYGIVEFVEYSDGLFECNGLVYKFSEIGKVVFFNKKDAIESLKEIRGLK